MGSACGLLNDEPSLGAKYHRREVHAQGKCALWGHRSRRRALHIFHRTGGHHSIHSFDSTRRGPSGAGGAEAGEIRSGGQYFCDGVAKQPRARVKRTGSQGRKGNGAGANHVSREGRPGGGFRLVESKKPEPGTRSASGAAAICRGAENWRNLLDGGGGVAGRTIFLGRPSYY